ncbi:hypothetical protein Tco_1446347 [Tanacetum coccineum]
MTDSLLKGRDEGSKFDGGSKHEEPLMFIIVIRIRSKDDNKDSDTLVKIHHLVVYVERIIGEIYHASNPLMSELVAIRNACRLAITYGWHNTMVESD